MIVENTRFGDIEYNKEDIISFVEPIIGFSQLKEFLLVEHPNAAAFYWLQSIEDGQIAFPCIDPLFFRNDYNIKLSKKDIWNLKADTTENLRVVAIINIPPNNPKKMTANLQAPVIINSENHLAKQMILIDTEYSVRHYVFEQEAGESA